MTHYITTAIPYVNASPHIGHALEGVVADVVARHWRQIGHDVRFLSGTDDYALTNAIAAESVGVPVREYVATSAADFEKLGPLLDLSLDDYIKTSSDPRHAPGVERLWRAIESAGDLYLRDYVGQYCVRCEAFYPPSELNDGRCPDHDLPTESVHEKNWFFRLSRHQEALFRLIESGQLHIEPEQRRNEVLGFIASGLSDISVSRSVERAHGWGLPVPGDPSQVVYVWFDALGNYITALGYGREDDAYQHWWCDSQRRVHVIGKGIVRFHAVYWPAFLLSAGEPLPTDVFVHDYVTTSGVRMSKTRGNTVDPKELIDRYGSDPLRWWCVAEPRRVGETEFSEELLVQAANIDLAGGIGNLVARIGGLESGGPPPPDALDDLIGQAPLRYREAIDRFDVRAAADEARDLIRSINQLLEQHEPWSNPAETSDIVAVARAGTDVVLDLLEPIVPTVVAAGRRSLAGDTSGPVFERITAE